MATIFIPSRRTRQPSGFVSLNTAIPRPSFLVCPSVGLMDWTNTSRIGTAASGDSRRGTTQGLAYKVARGAGAGLDFGTLQVLSGGGYTVIAFCNPKSESAVGALFSQRMNVSPYAQVNLFANSTNTSASAGVFELMQVGSASAATQYTASTAGVVDGGLNVYAATCTGVNGSMRLYRNGVNVTGASGGASVGALSDPAQKTRIGNIADFSSSGYSSDCDFPLVAVWERVLPDALLALATPTDIWSTLFVSETRRIYFGAAEGGTTDAAIAGTQATDVGAITVEATTGAALAGTQSSDVGAITVEATTGSAIAGTQSSDVGAITTETATSAAIAGAQATDVGAITAEATTGAAIAGTQASDGAAVEVTASTGQTDAAVSGTQSSDVGAIDVSATLGLALSGTQASDIGYIVVEATLPASMAGTQASDVAAITVAGTSIWTDVGVSAATWSDVGGATSIWTDL